MAANKQRGVILLEGLIALLIFTIGVLGLVGMFSVSIKNTSEAQFRTEAAFLADSLIGQLRVADPGTRATNFASPSGSGYMSWKGRVSDAAYGLPGATATPPTVTFSGSNNNVVTIEIFWRANNDSTVRKFITETALE